jgi:hypothetical protein
MEDPIADRLSILLFQHSILGILSRGSRRSKSYWGERKPIDMPRMSKNPDSGPWPIEALVETCRESKNLFSLHWLFSRLECTETYAPTLISRLPLIDWSRQSRLAFSKTIARTTGVAVLPASADARKNGCTASSLGLKQSEFRTLKQAEDEFRLSTTTSDSADFNPIELLDKLDQIAMCHVARSNQMVRLSSHELWNKRFSLMIPSYFERMLQGWCWVYSDQRSCGFARFFIERDAFNRMRKELGTAFSWSHTSIEQRNFFGPSDLFCVPKIRVWRDGQREWSRSLRRRAHTKRSHPNQLSLWA